MYNTSVQISFCMLPSTVYQPTTTMFLLYLRYYLICFSVKYHIIPSSLPLSSPQITVSKTKLSLFNPSTPNTMQKYYFSPLPPGFSDNTKALLPD